MSKNFATTIGNSIGSFMEVYCDGEGSCIGRYLRIKVLMDIRLPLLRAITVKHDGSPLCVKLRYERLMDFCYFCGIIGHDQNKCDQKLCSPSPSAVLEYGPFLTAETASNPFPERRFQRRKDEHQPSPHTSSSRPTKQPPLQQDTTSKPFSNIPSITDYPTPVHHQPSFDSPSSFHQHFTTTSTTTVYPTPVPHQYSFDSPSIFHQHFSTIPTTKAYPMPDLHHISFDFPSTFHQHPSTTPNTTTYPTPVPHQFASGTPSTVQHQMTHFPLLPCFPSLLQTFANSQQVRAACNNTLPPNPATVQLVEISETNMKSQSNPLTEPPTLSDLKRLNALHLPLIKDYSVSSDHNLEDQITEPPTLSDLTTPNIPHIPLMKDGSVSSDPILEDQTTSPTTLSLPSTPKSSHTVSNTNTHFLPSSPFLFSVPMQVDSPLKHIERKLARSRRKPLSSSQSHYQKSQPTKRKLLIVDGDQQHSSSEDSVIKRPKQNDEVNESTYMGNTYSCKNLPMAGSGMFGHPSQEQ